MTHLDQPDITPARAFVYGSLGTCVLLLTLVLLAAGRIREQRQIITTQKLEINTLLLAKNNEDITCIQWLLKSNLTQARDRICTYKKEGK